jgi:protein O-mannosyl-transferase
MILKAGFAKFHILIYPTILIAVGLIVYYNSFNGVFVFDDLVFIVDSLELRTLCPPWDAMFGGLHYTRPIGGLSFAINYAISGLEIWSYHLFNLVIHLVAGIALFGILTITLEKTPYRHISSILSLVISLIWLVHPLQTESVTYIIQRYESLMGMFFLLSVFSYTLSTRFSRYKIPLQAGSILFCYLGVGSKQVAVLIPVLILLVDRCFVTNSFKKSIKNAWGFLLLLFSSWIPMAILGITEKPFEWAGFDMQVVTPWKFALSEFGVIVHYLKLAFWPDPLVFDYFWQLAETPGEIIPYALIILLLVSLSIFALAKNHPLGFLGISFFLLLSPTSSIMPLSDLAADHRMYLPLAPVITFTVIVIYSLFQQGFMFFNKADQKKGENPNSRAAATPGTLAFIVFSVSAIIIFSTLTIERNALYSDKISIWRDTAEKAPHNARAWANLGNALVEAKQYNEAIPPLKKALELNPSYSVALVNMGFLYSLKNNVEKAIYYWENALKSRKNHKTYYNLGLLYQLQGNKEKAISYFENAVKLKPRWSPPLIRLSWLYATDQSSTPDERLRALSLALKANKLLSYSNPFFLDTLAASYAANLQFAKAEETQVQAVNLIRRSNLKLVTKVMLFRLRQYQSKLPFVLLSNQIDPTTKIPR